MTEFRVTSRLHNSQPPSMGKWSFQQSGIPQKDTANTSRMRIRTSLEDVARPEKQTVLGVLRIYVLQRDQPPVDACVQTAPTDMK